MPTPFPGNAAPAAVDSVYRVGIIATPNPKFLGTAFLHQSGAVITAAHVVQGIQPDQLVLRRASEFQSIPVANVVTDLDHDLALITPQNQITAKPFPLSSNRHKIHLGAAVTMWGYPSGYIGPAPLLTVGYLAGVEEIKTSPGKTTTKWVINAAINAGNSGSPLLLLDSDKPEVIGVAVSKLAPIPPHIVSFLNTLAKQQSGLLHPIQLPNGQTVQLTEGQLIAEVLHYLRSQIQLVIGYLTPIDDLRNFLIAQNINP